MAFGEVGKFFDKVELETLFHVFAQDLRGNSWMEVLKLLAILDNGWYYHFFDELNFYKNTLFYKANLDFFIIQEDFFHDNNANISSIPDWIQTPDVVNAQIYYGNTWGTALGIVLNFGDANEIVRHYMFDARGEKLEIIEFSIALALSPPNTICQIRLKDSDLNTLVTLELTSLINPIVFDNDNPGGFTFSLNNPPNNDYHVFRLKFSADFTEFKIYEKIPTTGFFVLKYTGHIDHHVISYFEMEYYAPAGAGSSEIVLGHLHYKRAKITGLYDIQFINLDPGDNLLDNTNWHDGAGHIAALDPLIALDPDSNETPRNCCQVIDNDVANHVEIIRNFNHDLDFNFEDGFNISFYIKNQAGNTFYIHFGSGNNFLRINNGQVYYFSGVWLVASFKVLTLDTWSILKLRKTTNNNRVSIAIDSGSFTEYTISNAWENSIMIATDNASNTVDFYFKNIEYTWSEKQNSREIILKRAGKLRKNATSLKSITIFGKKIDEEVSIPGALDDPSDDVLGDLDSTRQEYLVDDILETHDALYERAKNLLREFSINRTTFVLEIFDSDMPIRIGDFLDFKLDGIWYFNQFVRRIEFAWDSKNRVSNWIIETGRTFTEGLEKTQRLLISLKESLKQTKISRLQ